MKRSPLWVGLSVVVSALAVGVGAWQVIRAIQGSTPTVSHLESNIATNLDSQLMARAALSTGAPPTASVNCPGNAKLDKGSVFYCDVTITAVGPVGNTSPNGIPGPNVQTQTERLKVTMQDGGQAQWEVVSQTGP